jgi:phage terminase large subunit
MRLTTAFHKIAAMQAPIRVVQGGKSASKTFSIAQALHLISTQKQNETATIVTETYPQLRDGVISDFRKIFREDDLPFEEFYNKGDKDLTYPTGSIIQFRNADNKDFHRAKGARRDRLFINEGNRTSYATIDQMISRTDIVTYIDFNPDREFWVHEHLLGQPHVEHLVLTYKDNELIPEGELRDIERRIEASRQPGATAAMKNWVRIYAEGELGTYSERRIYQFDICEVPDKAIKIASGMDFGQSPDPTILVDLYVDGIDLYADERFCENNLMKEKIAGAERMSITDKMQAIDFPRGQVIIGDSAGKTEILDLRKHGYNVLAVKKRTGSVLTGIGRLRSYNLHITPRSVNLKKGMEGWFWKVDANDKIIPEPDGHEPDGLAAIRYAMMYHQNKYE